MTRGTPDAYVGTSEDGTPDFDVDGSDLATQDEVDDLAASKLDKSANLSDLASAPIARDNLELGDAATQDAADLPVSDDQAAALALKLNKVVIDVVADYGATPDEADSAAAFNAAIAAANAASARANGLGKLGVVIRVPQGNFNLPNGLTEKITSDAVVIKGDGVGATCITGTDGTLFYWGTGTGVGLPKSGGIEDIKFRYETPGSAAIIAQVDFAAELTFRNLKFAKIGQFLSLGVSSSRYANAIRISTIRGTVYNSGRPTIDVRHGAGLYATDVDLINDGVAYPSDTTSLHTAAAGTDFISATAGSWDTIELNNVLTNRFYRGLYVEAAAGSTVSNVLGNNVIFDYCAINAIRCNGTGGNARTWKFTNGYFVATDGHGVHIAASSGLVEGFLFVNCDSLLCGKNNWRVDSGVVKRVVLIACTGLGANRLDATNVGSEKDGTVFLGSDWSVIGGSHGLNGAPSAGFVNQARFGLVAATTSERYQVIGVTLAGATAEQSGLTAHTANGLSRSVRGVTTVAGTRLNGTSTAAHTIAATGVVMTNTLGFTVVMYVSGGTVTGISVNGIATGLTAGAITLAPGDTWAITYSAAPTVNRQVIAA